MIKQIRQMLLVILSGLIIGAMLTGGLILFALHGQATTDNRTDDTSETEVSSAEDDLTGGQALDNSAENETLSDAKTNDKQSDATENSEGDSQDDHQIREEDTGVVAKSRLPYYIRVNRLKNTVTIYTEGSNGTYSLPYKAMICSVGLDNRTPLGTFTISDKYKWRLLVGDVYGQYATRIYKGIMFHSVPYNTKNPGDLKEGEYNKLGQPASHGCIRLAVVDAKWIAENCPKGTIVEIYEDEVKGPLGRPTSINISDTDENKGWDPTDPDEMNPWLSIGPVINGAEDTEIQRGSTFDPTRGVHAKSLDGTDADLTVDGTVYTNRTGTYSVNYTARSKGGKSVSIVRKIKVVDKTKPVIGHKSSVYISDTDESNVAAKLIRELKITDDGQALGPSHIKLDTRELSRAMYWNHYGTCTCKVTATDMSGNKMEESFTVIYQKKVSKSQ